MPTLATPPVAQLPPALRLMRLKFRLLAAVSTEWAFGAAWKLFTTPRQLPEKHWEAAALAAARPFTVTTKTGSVAAYEWNPAGGRTVLLVHGWEHRASFWGVLARELVTAGFRLVALDGPALEWLLTRTGRDLGSLVSVLDRLDRESLAAKRRLTVPFLRNVLGEAEGNS